MLPITHLNRVPTPAVFFNVMLSVLFIFQAPSYLSKLISSYSTGHHRYADDKPT